MGFMNTYFTSSKVCLSPCNFTALRHYDLKVNILSTSVLLFNKASSFRPQICDRDSWIPSCNTEIPLSWRLLPPLQSIRFLNKITQISMNKYVKDISSTRLPTISFHSFSLPPTGRNPTTLCPFYLNEHCDPLEKLSTAHCREYTKVLRSPKSCGCFVTKSLHKRRKTFQRLFSFLLTRQRTNCISNHPCLRDSHKQFESPVHSSNENSTCYACR